MIRVKLHAPGALITVSALKCTLTHGFSDLWEARLRGSEMEREREELEMC